MKTSDLFMQKRQKSPKTLFAKKPELYLPAFSKLNMLKFEIAKVLTLSLDLVFSINMESSLSK